MLIRVMRRRANKCSEIFDFEDFVMRFENTLTESLEIEPLVRSAPHCPIVEIEAVNIDVGSQQTALNKQGPFRAPRPIVETNGGYFIITLTIFCLDSSKLSRNFQDSAFSVERGQEPRRESQAHVQAQQDDS